jgi:hypothetical protein
MTMWLAEYSCPRSNTGRGLSIIFTEDMPSFVERYPDVEFRLYVREECDVFTPAVVAACIGTSPSI